MSSYKEGTVKQWLAKWPGSNDAAGVLLIYRFFSG